MTPVQWTMLGIAFVIAVPAVLVLLYAMCRAAGEADDDADRYADEMQRRGLWS